MRVTNPRETYDDVHATEHREVLPAGEFSEASASEAATAGWVVLALAFDDENQVLLVDQAWADGWLAPGGARQPNESLAETVEREVREETGVEITPVRPHVVDEFTFVNERTGDTDGWTTVLFEAVADTTAIADELGIEGEEIDDARWFDGLPENVFNRELTETVYERCLRGD